MGNCPQPLMHPQNTLLHATHKDDFKMETKGKLKAIKPLQESSEKMH